MWRYSEWDNSSAPSDVFLCFCLHFFWIEMKQGHKFQGLEFKNAEQMWTGRFAVVPWGILNWADGRCLRVDFYIHFILGGVNSASNTRFLPMKSCFVSLCQFEIWQANIIIVHFSKASLYPWSDYCFFFFINLPTGCHLKVRVIPLKGTLQLKAVWSVSSWTRWHVQLNADSREETSKLELVSTVKNVWSDATASPPTYQQGIPRIPHTLQTFGVCEGSNLPSSNVLIVVQTTIKMTRYSKCITGKASSPLSKDTC